MGSLGGHLLPGAFFALFGIWWSFITAMRFVNATMNKKAGKNVAYRGSITMPVIFCASKRLRRAPIESWLKVILGGIGLAGEVITGIHWYADPVVSNPATVEQTGGHDHAHMHKRDAGHEHNLQPDVAVKTFHFEYVNSQHITMYSAFIIGAIVEIMEYHRFQMPKQLPYALGIIAFGIEGFLFANHLHSRHALDIHVHVLLVYSIYGCVIFSILETYNKNEIIFAYGRVLFTILQGK